MANISFKFNLEKNQLDFLFKFYNSLEAMLEDISSQGMPDSSKNNREFFGDKSFEIASTSITDKAQFDITLYNIEYVIKVSLLENSVYNVEIQLDKESVIIEECIVKCISLYTDNPMNNIILS